MKLKRRHSSRLSARSIFSKERREKGASIIIAFVFMLICVCICAIVLGFASTSSITARHKMENDSTYYALSSALENSTEMFNSGGPLKDMYMTDLAPSPTASTRVQFPDAASTPTAGTLPNAVYHWLAETVGVDASGAGNTLEVNVTTDAVAMPDVKLTYSMKSDYTIVITAVPDVPADSSGFQSLMIEIPRKTTAMSGLYGTTYSWNQDAG